MDPITRLPDIIKLTICDANSKIIIDVDKNILKKLSPYFDKLFTFGSEKFQSEITINVANSVIARDVILSRGNDNDNWKYLLETFRCKNYFGIDNDVSKLYDLLVPAEGFDFLLQVIEELNCLSDDKIIGTVKKNIPENYDLKNISTELINAMISKKYYLAFGDSNKKIIMMDRTTETDPLINPNTAIGQLKYDLKDHRSSIFSIAFSHDNRIIASGSVDETLKIWDVETGALINTISDTRGSILSVAFSYDDTIIAFIISNSVTINIYDITSKKICRKIRNDSEVLSIAFSPNNLNIISGNANKTIKIWDVSTGYIIKKFNELTGEVTSIAWSSDNHRIASCDNGNIIKIWKASTGDLLKILTDPLDFKYSIWSITFSPDSSKIASCGSSYYVKIWDAITGDLIYKIHGHNNTIWGASFSPDSLQLASVGSNDSIKIWDVTSGQLLHSIDTDANSVYCVAYSNFIYDDIDKKLIVVNYLNEQKKN